MQDALQQTKHGGIRSRPRHTATTKASSTRQAAAAADARSTASAGQRPPGLGVPPLSLSLVCSSESLFFYKG